jgi:hypothetical protein
MPRRALDALAFTRSLTRLEKCSSCVSVCTLARGRRAETHILMMSPIQHLGERTRRRRRIQFDAIHLRVLCHLWTCFHYVALFLLRSSQIGAALLNAAHLNERVAPRGSSLPRSGNARLSLFKFLRIILIQSVGWAKK